MNELASVSELPKSECSQDPSLKAASWSVAYDVKCPCMRCGWFCLLDQNDTSSDDALVTRRERASLQVCDSELLP